VASRRHAREAIEGGRVTVSGAPASKPTRMVAPHEPVLLSGDAPRFVSRGGDKLAGALERFAIDVTGLRALDAGASTGGFTDCLLQGGAAQVVAVDVGYGQLHERLRGDGRVEVHERTNVRDLAPGDLGEPFPLIVADLSFISLRTVAPNLAGLAAPEADLVLLVKPQFEAGREEASRGKGVIRDPEVWRRVLGEVVAALDAVGTAMMGGMASPLRGADGNVEFLVHARKGAPATTADLDAVVAEARTAPAEAEPAADEARTAPAEAEPAAAEAEPAAAEAQTAPTDEGSPG
jgi:23S rRNA (cytidine1920-2'-O)/16S rRNA (cytidine1409-2'-O)-methyltransferase